VLLVELFLMYDIEAADFLFFRNLLGWESKPRVWPGQAAPQRSIFAPLLAVFWWGRHQIFMLALARLR